MSIKLRRKKLSDGRSSLYLDIYFQGNRTYEFLHLYHDPKATKEANRETLQLAEQIRANRQLDHNGEVHGLPSTRHGRRNLIDYMETLKDKKAPRTADSWRCTINDLKAYAGEVIPFSMVTSQWIKGFAAYLLENYTQNTSALRLGVLKNALHRAVEDNIIRKVPFKREDTIRFKDAERSYLTHEELTRLAGTSCPNPEVARAFLFACYTGLRLSDIRALTWGKIDKNRIAVRQQKTKNIVYLDLAPYAVEVLEGCDKQNPTVFPLPATDTISRVLRKWSAAAKLEKDFTFHSSRHTFATMLLTYGADLYTVSKLLGHQNIAVTQIYAKIVDERKKAAVNLLPSLNADSIRQVQSAS